MASNRNRDAAGSTSSGLNQPTCLAYRIYSPFSKEKSKECILRFPALLDPKDKNTEWIYEDVFTIMRFLQQLFPEMEQAFTNLIYNADSSTFGSPRSAKQFFDRVNGLVSSVKKMLQGTSDLQNRHLRFESDDFANLLKLAYNAAIDDPENLNHESECFSEERYGETEYKTMDKVIEALQLTEQDHFLDLGSGCGQIVLYVAAKMRCKTSVGIEKVYERHKYARQLQRELLNILRWLNADEDLIERVESCVIERGDFLQESSRNHIKQSTAIYANNIVYGPKINLELTSIFKELLDDGVRIVCTLSLAGLRERGPSTRNFDDFAYLVDTEKLWAADMSWTSKKIDFTKHVVNRDKYRKVLESIDDPEKLQKLCAEFRRNRPNYREESDTDETVSYLSVPMPHHHYDQFQRLAAMRRSVAGGNGAGFIGLLDNNYHSGSDEVEAQQRGSENQRQRRGGGGPMQSSLNAAGRRSGGSRRRRYSDSEAVNDSPRRADDSMCTPGGVRSRLAHASMDEVMNLFSHLQDVTAASLRVGNDGTRCYDTTPKTAYDVLPDECRPAVNKWLGLTTRAYDVLMNPTAELELNNMRHSLQAQRIALIYEIAKLQADSRSAKRTFDEITHKTLQKFAQYGVCCSTTPALAEFILSTLTDHIKHFREFNDLSESLERDDATDHIMPEVRELVSSTLLQLDHAKEQLVAMQGAASVNANSAKALLLPQLDGCGGSACNSSSSSPPLSYFALNLLNTLLFEDGAMQQQQDRSGQSLNVLFDPRTHRYHLPLPPVQSLTSSNTNNSQYSSYKVAGASMVDEAVRMPSSMRSHNNREMMPSFVLVPPPSILQQQQQNSSANGSINKSTPVSSSSALADVTSMTNDIILCRKKNAEAVSRFGPLTEESQKENDNRLAALPDGGNPPPLQMLDANVSSLFSLSSAIDRAAELNQLLNYDLFQPVCVTSREQHRSKRILTPPIVDATGNNSVNNTPLALLKPLVSRLIETPPGQRTTSDAHAGGRQRGSVRTHNAGPPMAGKRRRDSFVLAPAAIDATTVNAGINSETAANINNREMSVSDADGQVAETAAEKLLLDKAAQRRKRPRKRDSDEESSATKATDADENHVEVEAERKNLTTAKLSAAAERRLSQESAVDDEAAAPDDVKENDNESLPPIAAKRLRRSAKVSRERGKRGGTLANGRKAANARSGANDDNDSDYAADEKLKHNKSDSGENESSSSDSSSSSNGESVEDEDDNGGRKAVQGRRGRRPAAGARPPAARRTYRSKRGGGNSGRNRTAAARRAAATARNARNNSNASDDDVDDDAVRSDAGYDEASEQNSDDDGSVIRVTRSAVRGTTGATKKQLTKAKKGKIETADDDDGKSTVDEDNESETGRKPAGRVKRSGKAAGRNKKAARAASTPTDDDVVVKSDDDDADSSDDEDERTKSKNAKKADSESLRSSASVDLPATPAPARRGRGRGRGGRLHALVGRRRVGGAAAAAGGAVQRSAAAHAHRQKIRAAIRQRREVISREGDQHEMQLSDDATLRLSDDDDGKEVHASDSSRHSASSPSVVVAGGGKKRRGSSSTRKRGGGKAAASSRRRGGAHQQHGEKQRSSSASPIPRTTSKKSDDEARSSNNTPLPPRLAADNKHDDNKPNAAVNRRLSVSGSSVRNNNKDGSLTPLAAAAAAAPSKRLSSVWKQHGGSFGGGSGGNADSGTVAAANATVTLISSGTVLGSRPSKAFLSVGGDERLNGSTNGITSPSHGPRLSNMKNKGSTAVSSTLSGSNNNSAMVNELYNAAKPAANAVGAAEHTTDLGNARGGTSESATSPHFSDITPVDDDEDDNAAAAVGGRRRKSGDLSIAKHDSNKVNGVLVGANDTLTLSPSLLSFGGGGGTPIMLEKLKSDTSSSLKTLVDVETKSNGAAFNGFLTADNDRQPMTDAEQDGGGSLMSIVRNEIGDLGDVTNQHSSTGFPPKISSSKPPPNFSGAESLQQTDVLPPPVPAAALPATLSTQLTITSNSHIAPPTILSSTASFLQPLLSTPSAVKPAAPLLSPPSNQLGPTIANTTMPATIIDNITSSSVENVNSISSSVSAASLLRAANVNNNHSAPAKPGRPRSNATNTHPTAAAATYSGRPPSQQQQLPQHVHAPTHQQLPPSPHKVASRATKKPRGSGASAAAAVDHRHHHRHGQPQQAGGMGLLNSPPALSSTSYTFPGSSSADTDVWTPAGAAAVPAQSSISHYADIMPLQAGSSSLHLQSLGGVSTDGLKMQQQQPLMPPPPSHSGPKSSVHSSGMQHSSWLSQASHVPASSRPMTHQQQGRSNNNDYLASRGSIVASAAAAGPSVAAAPTPGSLASYQNPAQHGAGVAAYGHNISNQQQHTHAGFVLQPPTSAAAGFMPPQPQQHHHHHHSSQQQQHLHQQANMAFSGVPAQASASNSFHAQQQQQQHASILQQQQQHSQQSPHLRPPQQQAVQLAVAAQYQNNFNYFIQQQQQQRSNNNYQQPSGAYGQPAQQQQTRHSHHSSQVASSGQQPLQQPHYGSANHSFSHFHG